MQQRSQTTVASQNTSNPLTPKEREVVQALLSEHITAKQIAKLLVISKRTAEVHLRNIMKKWGCQSKTEIVLRAKREGL